MSVCRMTAEMSTTTAAAATESTAKTAPLSTAASAATTETTVVRETPTEESPSTRVRRRLRIDGSDNMIGNKEALYSFYGVSFL